jgi:hypothetical protein
MPKVFISYSWDDDAHKAWVRNLAARLRQEGIETLLDQWHLVPGDQLPRFMETSVRESDFALIVCTPRYKQRSDSRAGGVGYEGDIMTGEVYIYGNTRKFIPILSRGTWAASAPSWLQGKYYLDFGRTPPDDTPYGELVATILGRRPDAPPVGLAASIQIEALFGNQKTLVVSPVSDDPSRGYSSFLWTAAYEFQNRSGGGVTINRIENVLSPITIEDNELRLMQDDTSTYIITIYDDFAALTGDRPAVSDRLPYTFKPWTKVYVEVTSAYHVTNHGRPLFCKDENQCYNLLTVALGVALKPDGSRPAIIKKFQTVVQVDGFGDLTSDQEAILLTPGCKIDFGPLMERSIVPKAKQE